jgi:hypothetical protein
MRVGVLMDGEIGIKRLEAVFTASKSQFGSRVLVIELTAPRRLRKEGRPGPRGTCTDFWKGSWVLNMYFWRSDMAITAHRCSEKAEEWWTMWL